MQIRKQNLISLFVLHLIILLSFSSCLFDGGSKTRIIGNYYLHRWEGGTPFYIVEKCGKPGGGGLIKGTVQEIGWNEEYIFAKRNSTFGGDPNGWMVINVNTGKIVGPFSDEEIESKQKEILHNQEVKKYPPAKAWEILKGK